MNPQFWSVAAIAAAVAFALGFGLAIWLARRRLRALRRRFKQTARRSEGLPGAHEILPIDVPQFRRIVGRLAAYRAEQLSARLQKPLRFTAQDGEDALLGAFFDYRPHGFYVEIGAFDGVELSNTYFFEQLGWTGVLIEPIPSRYEACVRNRPGSRVVHAALGLHASGTTQLTEVQGQANNQDLATFSYVAGAATPERKAELFGGVKVTHTVPFRSFEDVMGELAIAPTTPIDFISIDCEGMDFEIVQSIDLAKWRPRLLLLETIAPDVLDYLAARGYRPVLRIRANTIFGREAADAAADAARLTPEQYWQALGVGNVSIATSS